MPKAIFCLMGPTASGKTSLAMELVRHFPFEIISVDSAMLYQDMHIGTAKPTPEELRAAPHHLIDCIAPTAAYSVATFCDEARALCQAIQQRGNMPLLVGGTMMYFNALQQGLSPLPQADPALRQRLEADAKQQGWPALHAQLAAVDPVTAARVHAHDNQRIQRALEVYYLTGSPLTDFLQKTPAVDFHATTLILFPQDRAWLHARIAQRFDAMLDLGLVDEVKQLQAKWHVTADMPSMRCVGYRQVLAYLQQEYAYTALREKGIAATRQLAKRQLTWLRSWDQGYYFDPKSPTCTQEVLAKIREIVDNERH